jgi:hypothetical protein
MTKYTIFCVLGLALLIQGGKHWMTPATTTVNKPVVATNSDAGPIEPLTNTAHADSLAVTHSSSNDSPQAGQPARQPDRSFTPGSTFLATAAQVNKDTSPALDKTDAAPPSVLVTTPQPPPLEIKPTFVPQPREAGSLTQADPSPTANVVSKQETPLTETPLNETTDSASERPRLPADLAVKGATGTAESAALIADSTGKSSALPSFTTLKPLVDNRVPLIFPTTAQMQIQLDPTSPYGPAGQDPGPTQAITNAMRFNEARNPMQVKADSLVSHNLLQGAQLAYQQPQFPGTNKLEGKELTIQDLFIMTTNRDQRFGLLKAYWKVALAMAEYHWAVEEYLTIRTLDGIGVVGGQASPSHIYIEAAIFASMARVSETRKQAIIAQFELLTLMGGQYRNLPLAIDVPLVGTYNTQFEANYPNPLSAPKRLQAINKTIDNCRDTVNSRGITIDRIFKAWQAAILLFQQNPRSEQNAQVVALAYEQLTRARRGFLGSIREYNSDIAEYALTVLNPSFRPDQLARYLTRTPSPRPLWNTSAMNPGETTEVQASLPESRVDGQVVPSTFADGATDDWSQKTKPALPSVMKQN